MTSHNARLNQATQVNDQLKTLALKFAIESRYPDEKHEETMRRAKDYYEFVRVSGPSSLVVAAGTDLPNPQGAA